MQKNTTTPHHTASKVNAQFFMFFTTFKGARFLDTTTGKTLTRTQVFWRNIRAAVIMAESNTVSGRYTLVYNY